MVMKRKTVLVACGAGIATSTVVCEKIEELIRLHGLNAQVVQCKIVEVARLAENADLLVTTTIVPRDYPIPVVKGTPYLTGMNTEKADQEIIQYLKG